MNMLSLELRNRVQFGYPFYLTYESTTDLIEEIQSNEKHALCFNGYLGWKFSSDQTKVPKLGAYVRDYTGINPHGQFTASAPDRFSGRPNFIGRYR